MNIFLKENLPQRLVLIVTLITIGFIALIGVNDFSGPFLFLFFFIFALIVVNRLYGLFYWIDPTSFFIVSYYGFVVVGTLFFSWFNLELGWLSSLLLVLGLSAFIAGAMLRDILDSPPGRIRIRREIVVVTKSGDGGLFWLILFFLFGNILIAYYYLRIGTIPLLAIDAETVRVESLAGQARIPIFGYAFINVAVAGLTAHVARRSLWMRLAVAILALLGVIMLLGIGYRVLAVKVFLSTFVAYFFVRRSSLPIIPLVTLSAIIVTFLGLVGFYRVSGSFIGSLAELNFAFQRVIWALFVRYLYVYDMVVTVFPNTSPFLFGGSYTMTAATALPGAQIHFGHWLRDELGLVLSSPGPVDPTIIGEFYINFGTPGIAIGMFMLGFALHTTYLWIRGDGKISYDRLVLLTLISTSTISIVASGITSVLLFDLLPLLSVFCFYNLCRRISYGTFRRPHLSFKERV
ncbi:oligosaccharide repeat unit polymerase [Candidatus Gracilibacteria bacterium]|nr:oligosaccharide repeat unit polymerase [Candidatus Gracilibacteria bacterium]